MKNNRIIHLSIFLGLLALAVIFIAIPTFNERHSNISLAMTLLFGAASYYFLKDFSRAIAIGSVILLLTIYNCFDYAFDIHNPTFFRMAILISQTAIFIFAYFCGKITRIKTTERIKQEVSKYVSPTILDNLDADISMKTAGRRENVTVMFLDIRGFTSISEQHTAEEVTEILNDYFKEIIPVIKKHHGVINKFIGDAILAVFSGETPEIHAKNAVRAGKAILKRLKNFQHIQEAQGREKIQAGIGVNTGIVFLGDIGNDERCEYTVIGDTVNVANRAERANRIYKTEFLITENTYPYVKDIADVIKISDVQMKGKREKVNVYEVLRVSEPEEE
ncbi:MAG: adenylate/guanylate cyclase domain-containing protein [bacterium]|nr:adenylate/guanylate cyclase domain-containing protein [bacterium]